MRSIKGSTIHIEEGKKTVEGDPVNPTKSTKLDWHEEVV